MNFLQDVSYAKSSDQFGQPWFLNCFQSFLSPACGDWMKGVGLGCLFWFYVEVYDVLIYWWLQVEKIYPGLLYDPFLNACNK